MTDFNTPDWDSTFHTILTDMRLEKCILFIGPESIKIGDKHLRDVMRDQLLVTHAKDITHFYDRDGFYLFPPSGVEKQDIQREVVLFYEKNCIGQGVEERLLRQLVRFRTPIIISINPDNFLSEIAHRYGIKHDIAFFKHGGGAVQDIEMPSADAPIFYNLFGSLVRDDSLVLDYEDLFSLLKSLLGSPGLPPNLSARLHEARHFLFVGFDFEKWYTQLLLQILSNKKKPRKFVIDPSKKNDNTTLFLVKQFQISFIEDEIEFLNELFQRADTEGLLRNILDDQTSEVVKVKHLLQNGNVLGALNEMRKNPKLEHDSIMLLAKYNMLKDQETAKTINNSDLNVGLSQVADAINNLLKI